MELAKLLLLVIYQLWISGYRLLLKSVGVTVYSIYVPNIYCLMCVYFNMQLSSI